MRKIVRYQDPVTKLTYPDVINYLYITSRDVKDIEVSPIFQQAYTFVDDKSITPIVTYLVEQGKEYEVLSV
jgi:hypothetical protein